jgi:hypothetical protein
MTAHTKWQLELQQEATAALPKACKLPPSADDVDMLWGAATNTTTHNAASTSSSSSDSLDVDCLIDGVIAAELSLSFRAVSSCQAGCDEAASSSSSDSSACSLPALHMMALQQQQSQQQSQQQQQQQQQEQEQEAAPSQPSDSRAYDDAWQRLCYFGPASAEQQQWLAQLQRDSSRFVASPFAACVYAPL